MKGQLSRDVRPVIHLMPLDLHEGSIQAASSDAQTHMAQASGQSEERSHAAQQRYDPRTTNGPAVFNGSTQLDSGHEEGDEDDGARFQKPTLPRATSDLGPRKQSEAASAPKENGAEQGKDGANRMRHGWETQLMTAEQMNMLNQVRARLMHR